MHFFLLHNPCMFVQCYTQIQCRVPQDYLFSCAKLCEWFMKIAKLCCEFLFQFRGWVPIFIYIWPFCLVHVQFHFPCLTPFAWLIMTKSLYYYVNLFMMKNIVWPCDILRFKQLVKEPCIGPMLLRSILQNLNLSL